MNATAEQLTQESSSLKKPHIVIIGAGPVGLRFIEEIYKWDPGASIALYGDEPWEPYNRIKLSSLLAGDAEIEDLKTEILSSQRGRLLYYPNCPIQQIDRINQCVTDAQGKTQHYDVLVLAVGSRPHIPNIEHLDSVGVFRFRDMSDAQALKARQVSSRHTVVLGGGLLGIEAARAMARSGTKVSIVQHSDRLMNRQLDAAAAAIVENHLTDKGIQTFTQRYVKSVEKKDGRIHHLVLDNGETLLCDTLIVSAGISPRKELAIQSGLAAGQGIRINNFLQTSDSNIYAIGECAEHDDKIYGLVAPGFEQAAILAHNLTHDTHMQYHGTISATRLKVAELPVFSSGMPPDSIDNLVDRVVTFQTETCYRQIILRRGKLLGAFSVGEWKEIARVQEAVEQNRYLSPWHRWHFSRTGDIWLSEQEQKVIDWPASAVVCNCMNRTRGELTLAVSQGCDTLEALKQKTGASTVCGSCQPLLAQIVGAKNLISMAQDLKDKKALIATAVFTLCAAVLFWFFPTIPNTSTVQGISIDYLWTDGLIKQITGYTLLTLSVITLLLSLRKRIKRFQFGAFHFWRAIHTIVGSLAIVLLITHTGLSLGENLNAWLMVSFLSVLTIGTFTGLVVANENKLGSITARRLRKWTTRFHIYAFWPLPVLLAFHIVSVYYF